MATRTIIAYENQSCYDLIIQLYGSMEYSGQFFADNKDILTNGYETDMKGLTVSYEDTLGVRLGVQVKSREEGGVLGSQPTFIDSITFSVYETYSGYTYSSTIIDHPFGLYITYSFTPATASDPSLTFTTYNTSVLNYAQSQELLLGNQNGTSQFEISADDRGGTISYSDTITVENQRMYEDVVSNMTAPTFDPPLDPFTYELYHDMIDDIGTYWYNNGVSNDMWLTGGTYSAPLPTDLFGPGIMSFGSLTREAVYASYSNTSLIATASNPDQWLHCTFRNQDQVDPGSPADGPLTWGINNYINVTYTGGTTSTIKVWTTTGTKINFSMEDDVKFYRSKWISVDLLFNVDDDVIKLIVNGKLTIVNGGSSFDANGEWAFTLPSSPTNDQLYIHNIPDGYIPGDANGGAYLVDDIWYISLNSGGHTIYDFPIDYVRDYLNYKHGA